MLSHGVVLLSGKPQTGQRAEPEGRKIVAHGAKPWVAGGQRLSAPERGVRRDCFVGSFAPSRGRSGTVFLPVLAHWASQCWRTGLLSFALRAGPHEDRRDRYSPGRFPAGRESRILNVSLIGRGGKCRDSPGGD